MVCTTPSGSQTLASTIVFSFSWRRLHSRAVCGKIYHVFRQWLFFFPSSLSPSQFQSQLLYIFNATLQFFFLLDLIHVFFIAIFLF
jgi:hypothetical protein